MKRDFILNRIIKVMLLVLSMTVGQNALAESSWTVENSNGNSNTFTIKRSEKGYAQKVLYRTVSLSAYAGQHYTAKYGELEFLENEDTKTVTVTESTPNVDSYKYQNGATRQYKLEVTDRAGLLLASATRDMTIGYNVASSGVFDNKSYTIRSSEVTVTEDGYAQSSNPHTVASTQFYTEGTKAYLVYLNAELRMRLEFQAKEVNDGYQYVQILTDNTTGCDTGAGDGNPGTPKVSHYMAGFDIGGKGVDTYYKYSFPVPSVGNDAGATKPWTELSNSVADLKKQKFNTGCRASDGRLILPTGFSTLVVRFNASGSDEDDWKAKDIKAFIQASDATMPTKLSVSAAPGRHAKGNTVYVSVAFSEIVTVTGTPTLTTTSDNHWGSLSYVAGSGTNVLTFSTIIPQDATGNLNVTGYSGTITDLAGNAPSSVTASSLCSLDDYDLSLLSQDGSGHYLIVSYGDLHILSGYVSGGNNCSGLTFRQVADIAFAHTTNWNNSSSTENNFTAIGDDDHRFQGTYDGDGHTISGIRIYKGGDKKSDSHQGLFGMVGSGGTVKRVTLADARITGSHYTGGIAGATFSCTIEDCTVEANVCIHAVQLNTNSHGGIVGLNQTDHVRRCISRATLTVADASYCKDFGGIVGFNTHCITDCIAEGVVIPDVNGRGAIVGYKSAGTLSRNYYRSCTVAGVANATGVGQGTSESSTETSDPAGARALYALSLPANTVIVRTPSATLPGTNNVTYDNGVDINGVPYAKSSSVVNLSYNPAAITEGYDVLLAVNKNSNSAAVSFTDNGDYTYTIALMPVVDITVSATEIPIIAYIDADGNPQSHACTPIVEGTTSYQTPGRTEGWYVVNSDVTFNNQTVKFLDQTVHVILCDGAQFSINSGEFSSLEVPNGSLEILAQSNGSGKLDLRSSGGNALKVEMNKNRCIDINGGNIRIHDGTYGIFAVGGTVTIRRGTVSISGRTDGIKASNIILGCSNVNDRIYVKSYDGTVTISDGQILSDGNAAYSGSVTASDINGKTLWPDLWDVAGGNDGSTAEKAYTITTTGGLDQLAAQVKNSNSTNNFVGKYFRLGADITYGHKADNEEGADTENNFTPIGTINNGLYRYFSGTFDGQGHTISGIRIYKGGDTDHDGRQGLFGMTLSATIKNVILADARITGRQDVGGIAGYFNGTVENCRVGNDVTIHAVANDASSHGGVVGDCNGGTISGCVSSATLTVANGLTGISAYGGVVGYLNGDMSDCLTIDASVPAVNRNAAIAGNVGFGSTRTNNYHHDCTVGGNAALSNTYTVSAGTDVTVAPAGDADATYEYNGIKRYGDALYYGGVLYAPRDASVCLTLGYNGSVPTDLSVGYDASVGTLSGSANPYTLTMPAGDVTINAFFGVEVPYNDEKGVEHIAIAIPLDNTMTTLAAGTYVVNSDVAYTGTVTLSGDVTLILGDGATMSVNQTVSNAEALFVGDDAPLTIYGQTLGTGTLTVTNSGGFSGIRSSSDITINGGIIETTGSYGIHSYSNITLSGGTITATGTTATGIMAEGTSTRITLGGATVTSNSYSADIITIVDGMGYVDGTGAVYYGTLWSESKAAIANKTLTKDMSWTNLKAAFEAGGTQTVTLTNNVIRINSDCINASGTVTLDLNGYTIDGGTSQTNPLFSVKNGVSMTITDSRTGGNLCNPGNNATVSVNGGTLTLASGTINAQSYGVLIWEGNFNMTGGTITGGIRSGVNLYGDNATFTMSGGTITGNNAGVNVSSATATFTVSGNVDITGNTTCDVNMYYNGNFINPIRISGALNEAARIGINIDDDAANAITGNVVMVFTDGLKGKGSKQNFVLNGRDGHTLVTDGPGEVGIAVPYSLTVPDNVTVSGFETVSFNTYEVGCGDVVTLLYGGDDVSAGYSVRYTVPNGAFTYLGTVDAQGKTAKFTMPGSNTTITKEADNAHYTFGDITLRETFSDNESQGLDATFDGSSEVTVDIPNDITVKSVAYDREFTAGRPATVMLPFDYTCNGTEGGKFYTFAGVEQENGQWIATMKDAEDPVNKVTTLTANTPYLVMPSATSLTFAGGVTLNTTTNAQQTADAGSHWTFKGTYSYIKWTSDTSDPDYTTEREAEIGKVYGFAGVQKTDIEVGDFVRVASGAKIRPMGCYLLWNDTPNASLAPARGMNRAASVDELPKSITVRLINANGTVTNVGEIDMETGEISFEGWYTLQGVKLEAEPTEPGIYINNGKKVSIK